MFILLFLFLSRTLTDTPTLKQSTFAVYMYKPKVKPKSLPLSHLLHSCNHISDLAPLPLLIKTLCG